MIDEEEFRRLHLNEWPAGQSRESGKKAIELRMYSYPADVKKWLDAIDMDFFARIPGADWMREHHGDDDRYIKLADKWPSCVTPTECWQAAFDLFVKEDLFQSLENARKAIEEAYSKAKDHVYYDYKYDVSEY